MYETSSWSTSLSTFDIINLLNLNHSGSLIKWDFIFILFHLEFAVLFQSENKLFIHFANSISSSWNSAFFPFSIAFLKAPTRPMFKISILFHVYKCSFTFSSFLHLFIAFQEMSWNPPSFLRFLKNQLCLICCLTHLLSFLLFWLLYLWLFLFYNLPF